MFINHSENPDFREFNKKAIALPSRGRYAPFPTLFLIHEMRVRGFHPFQEVVTTIPNEIRWQEWIVDRDVFDDTTGDFKRGPSPNNNGNQDGNNNGNNNGNSGQSQSTVMGGSTSGLILK